MVAQKSKVNPSTGTALDVAASMRSVIACPSHEHSTPTPLANWPDKPPERKLSPILSKASANADRNLSIQIISCPLSTERLCQIDLLSRAKHSALPSLYVSRYSP